MFVDLAGPHSAAAKVRTRSRSCVGKMTVLTVAAALALSGCAGHQFSEAKDREETVMRMIGYFADPQKPDETNKTVGKLTELLSVPGESPDELKKVIKQCKLDREWAEPPEVKALIAPAIIAVLAPLVLDFAFGKIREGVAAEKLKYTASYGGQVSDTFYYPTKNNGRALRWPCFHFQRVVSEGKEKVVAADVVGKFTPSPDGTALKVLPLRTYFARAKAKVNEKGQYGVAFSLTLRSLMLNDKQEAVESNRQITLINQKVSLPANQKDAKPTYHSLASNLTGSDRTAFTTSERKPAKDSGDQNAWAATGWLPGVPISTAPKAQTKIAPGNFTLIAAVVENGDGADLYALLEQALPAIEGILKKQVMDAIAQATAKK